MAASRAARPRAAGLVPWPLLPPLLLLPAPSDGELGAPAVRLLGPEPRKAREEGEEWARGADLGRRGSPAARGAGGTCPQKETAGTGRSRGRGRAGPGRRSAEPGDAEDGPPDESLTFSPLRLRHCRSEPDHR